MLHIRVRATLLAVLLASALWLGAPSNTSVVLYDALLRTPPQAQGWSYLFSHGLPSQQMDERTVTLDTRSTVALKAGYFASQQGFVGSTAPVPTLDRTVGFTVTFTLQLLAETHSASNNRAGFSIIVLSSDAHGIELGFWADRIWAQEGGTTKLFTQAEAVAYNTTAALARYDLSIKGDRYELRGGGKRLLSGPVRSYAAFIGQPDPYETPNFLFVGDDTSSAAAQFRLGQVSVMPISGSPGLPHGQYLRFVPVVRR